MNHQGAGLSRAFHADVVAPLLKGIRYAAARLGSGSDVLGLDDALSRDHDWGCRLTVLTDDPDAVPEILRRLEGLPDGYEDHPVRFPVTWDDAMTHNVEVATVGAFAESRLGVDPTDGLSTADWLVLTGQSILEVTAGPVFADQTKTLAPLRGQLAWYPADLERYVVACAWQRIAEYMPMVGRTAERGDELGSRLLSARLADDIVHLAFVLCRRWPPYPKWRGTVFAQLPVSLPVETVMSAPTWQEREAALAEAAEELLNLQRERLPAPDKATIPFFNRPYRTTTNEIPEMLLADIEDPHIRSLPLIGSVEQWADNVKALTDATRRASLRIMYG
ncbi:DUF4037 domain-containing protein [Actinomadura barringtoniae]|uniref:DUF4037 domain-containing protein n=1 Tax=Actinomadura barringtoniae TaxID=1427535 RepID=A0A939PD37_9ACTN|nr:DUF4037 domain-containing protein [Actinomadura barringtoniae]MBO2450416.1 DUF4037 domain-containing protein [Actinomadura barringtoniae]